MPSSLACSGCGWAPPDDDPYPFRCANAGSGDDVDHVIVRTLDASKLSWPTGTESNTFAEQLGQGGEVATWVGAV